MTTVIRAENLGRQYLIRHKQQGQRFTYDSLGESLVNGGRAFCNRQLHPFASRFTISATHLRRDTNKAYPFALSLSKGGGRVGKPFMVRQGSPERSRRAHHERLNLSRLKLVATMSSKDGFWALQDINF